MRPKKIALICACMFCMAAVSGCTRALPESGRVSETARADAKPLSSFETETVWCERDGKRIFGIMYIPQDEKKTHPALVISHGYGGSYRDGTQYAEMLAQNGYAVYCFDFCGGSTQSLSDGTPLEMSFFSERQDLEAVLDMMRNHPAVDPDNIFLMGISQGGAVSAMTAAAQPDKIKGMTLFFPAFNLVDEITDMFDSPDDIPEMFYFLWMRVGRPYGDIWGYDIYGDISSYGEEFLILHGDEDSIVPISYSRRAAEVCPSAELIVFPGADHGFSEQDSVSAFEHMLNYMNSRLN